MIEVPKRASLVEQVVEILRRNLRSPDWADGIPTERALCDRLQISRPTLRAAFEILRREGLVRFSENRRKRLPIRSRKLRTHAISKTVGFIASEPMHGLLPSSIFTIDELRRHLQDAGLQLEVRADARLKQRNPTNVLAEFAHKTRASCWVIHRASAQVQRWFAEQRFNVVVLGSCHEGIQLPSLDFDYHGVARHAAGVLLGKGHRRIALLLHRSGLAGDLVRVDGFGEAFCGVQHTDATPMIMQHDGGVKQIQSAVRRLFASASPPTGIIVSHAVHVLTVMTQLMDSGVHIPKDVSVVSCDDQMFLDYITPTVARYRFDWAAYARLLSRMVVRLATRGSLANRPIRIIPDFQPGDSLGLRG